METENKYPKIFSNLFFVFFENENKKQDKQIRPKFFPTHYEI